MLIDTHIHIGQFEEEYYSPAYVSQLMKTVGVDYYAVSSTSMCEENYEKVLAELRELISIDGDRVLPVMWITPEGLKGNIAWFLESEIRWKCLKIHPFLHQKDWMPGGGLLEEVLDIAEELHVPLLIHTGNENCCRASLFESVIREHSNIQFILAHGRPAKDAIGLISMYDNVYVDTAFMDVNDILLLVNSSRVDRILWGTDMCIPQHFYSDADMKKYYESKLQRLKNVCPVESIENITHKNAIELLGLGVAWLIN